MKADLQPLSPEEIAEIREWRYEGGTWAVPEVVKNIDRLLATLEQRELAIMQCFNVIIPQETAELRATLEQRERELAKGFRCFYCKQVFTDDGLATQHFGKNPIDFPLCIADRLKGCGGGPHDAYVSVRKDELARLDQVTDQVKTLTEQIAQEEKDSEESAAQVYRLDGELDTLKDQVKTLREALEATKCRCSKAVDAKCLECGSDLHHVRNDSALNEEQFDSVKAGDWYCTDCKDSRTKSGFKYFWDRELPIITYQQCPRCAALVATGKP